MRYWQAGLLHLMPPEGLNLRKTDPKIYQGSGQLSDVSRATTV